MSVSTVWNKSPFNIEVLASDVFLNKFVLYCFEIWFCQWRKQLPITTADAKLNNLHDTVNKQTVVIFFYLNVEKKIHLNYEKSTTPSLTLFSSLTIKLMDFSVNHIVFITTLKIKSIQNLLSGRSWKTNNTFHEMLTTNNLGERSPSSSYCY